MTEVGNILVNILFFTLASDNHTVFVLQQTETKVVDRQV